MVKEVFLTTVTVVCLVPQALSKEHNYGRVVAVTVEYLLG